MLRSLVGSEMCIRDRYQRRVRGRAEIAEMTIGAGRGRLIIACSIPFSEPWHQQEPAITFSEPWVHHPSQLPDTSFPQAHFDDAVIFKPPSKPATRAKRVLSASLSVGTPADEFSCRMNEALGSVVHLLEEKMEGHENHELDAVVRGLQNLEKRVARTDQRMEMAAMRHTDEILRRVAGCLDEVVSCAVRNMVEPMLGEWSENMQRVAARQVQHSAQEQTERMRVGLEVLESRMGHQFSEVDRGLKDKLDGLQRYTMDLRSNMDGSMVQIQKDTAQSQAAAAELQAESTALKKALRDIQLEAQQSEEVHKQRVDSLASKLAAAKAESAAKMEESRAYLGLTEHGLLETCGKMQEQLDEIRSQNTHLKHLVLKSFRQDQDAQELLKEYVGHIASQVSQVMNYAMTIRLEENNKLIDATLRDRVPDYVKNASTAFALVRNCNGSEAVVLPHQQDESMQELMERAQQLQPKQCCDDSHGCDDKQTQR
eukprot:TRINITY_DN10530_c0_g1_i1.p1 TRINITY_DN10530_c0_g1~~TRINITY_DN10530_c0_g1_i1.p1  ORF type:complete len:522 (+),score=144.41 TRINITY_DN10530_c0_g1_i1:116-1567(+)